MEFMKNERDLLEQANNVATLGEFLALLQRCDECIEPLEERSRAKRPRLEIFGGRDRATRGCEDSITKTFYTF